MKILHVSEVIRGGVGNIIEQLVNNDKVNDFIVIYPAVSKTEISLKNCKSIQYERSGRNIKSFIKLAIAFIKVLKDEKPELVHIHSTFAGLICRIIIILTRYKGKVVFCPHAFSFMMKKKPLVLKIYGAIERILSRYTSRIICTSNYEKELAISYGLESEKMVVIYNSVNPPNKYFDDNPYDPSKTNILFVGRFSFQKGFDIVQNLSIMLDKSYQITAIGDYDNESERNKIMDNITHIGWISSLEIAKYYYYADAVIMPSRWESFGLVAVEAQSYGTPVLASNNTSLPEVIIDKESGYLFETDNILEIYQLVNSLKKEQLKAMRVFAYDNYIGRFITDNMINEVNILYKQLTCSQ